MGFVVKLSQVFTVLVLAGFSLNAPAISAQKNVGTLTDDTYLGRLGTAGDGSVVTGAEANMVIRAGSDNTQNGKTLIKFDLAEAIDPDLPYFLEITTDDDGNSGNTFGAYSITDPDLQSILDETTLTWNIAAASAPNAVASYTDFNAAGNLVAQFSAPGHNTAILLPLFGSDIQTFGGGSGSAAFGFASNLSNAINIKSKEHPTDSALKARLYSYDVFDSNGTGGGAINTASTWANNAVPVATNYYRVLTGDTVTANGSFAGDGMLLNSGAILNFTADGFSQKFIIANQGANLTQNSAGDFALGDINNLGTFILNGTATMNPSAGSDIFLDMNMSGNGNLIVNSNDPNSDLYLTSASAFLGTVMFAGSGDEVLYSQIDTTLDYGIGGRLEMNSTGANRIVYEGATATGGTTAFNQPGFIEHRSTIERIQGTDVLEVNAPVSIDLTQPFPGDARRYFIRDTMSGAADVIINGTLTPPVGATLNEFELDNTDQSGVTAASTYSGTITTNNLVNVEIRRELPAAAFVINSGGHLEMGYREIDSLFSMRMGEIAVNAGAKLEVGYEEDDEHVPMELHLSNDSGRSGDLTLSSTSTLIMQVSGTGVHDFDTILVDGTANLDGTLEILVNPAVPSQTDTITNGPFVPVLGQTFDIIRVSSGLTADFDGLNGVDGADLAIWQASYGVNDMADADGDGDSDGADFLAWQREFGMVGSPGTIIDNSIVLNVIDLGSTFTGTGLEFQLNVSSTLVQLEVVSTGAVTAVPEPSTCLLLACAIFGYVGTRRNRG